MSFFRDCIDELGIVQIFRDNYAHELELFTPFMDLHCSPPNVNNQLLGLANVESKIAVLSVLLAKVIPQD